MKLRIGCCLLLLQPAAAIGRDDAGNVGVPAAAGLMYLERMIAEPSDTRPVRARAEKVESPRGSVDRGPLRTVHDYGATCDGVKDDAPAFQAAVNANGAVLVPECGSGYLVNTTVHIPAGVSLVGTGSALPEARIATTKGVDTFAVDGADVTFRDLNVLHNGTAGSIIRSSSAGRRLTVVGGRFTATSKNSDPLVYSAGEYAILDGLRFSNARGKSSWSLQIVNTGSALPDINLGTLVRGVVMDPYAEGNGIFVGPAGNGDHRIEGLRITGSDLSTRGVNLRIEEVLVASIVDNDFGVGPLDGGSALIQLAPSGHNIFQMLFRGNNVYGAFGNEAIKFSGTAMGETIIANNVFSFHSRSVDFPNDVQGTLVVNNIFDHVADTAITACGTRAFVIEGNLFAANGRDWNLDDFCKTSGDFTISNNTSTLAKRANIETINDGSRWKRGIGSEANAPSTVSPSGYRIASATNRGIVATGESDEEVIVDPAGPLAALTLELPACSARYSGKAMSFATTQPIIALSVIAKAGVVSNAPTTLAIGQGIGWRCHGTVWYRRY
jgi:hypothetical protein